MQPLDDPIATLGDLLDEPGLGLELVVGDESSRDRRLGWAHTIEIRHPVQWLDSDWLMLTTGAGWPTKKHQRELIRELDAGEVSALGFGLGVRSMEVPVAMREAAEQLRFPIFTAPDPKAFREVTRFVQLRALTRGMRGPRALAAMQLYLGDALRGPSPLARIVARLRELTGAEVAVVDSDGAVVEGACALSPSEVVRYRERTGSRATRIETARFRGWMLSIGDGPGAGPSLMVSVLDTQGEPALLEPAAESALPLLDAAWHVRDARRVEERAAKRATLDALLSAMTLQEGNIAEARAASWGVELGSGVRVVIARSRSDDSAVQNRIDEIQARLEAGPFRALVTGRNDDVVFLIPADVPVETLQGVVFEADPNLHLGSGRAVRLGMHVSESHADADVALRLSRAPGSRPVSYDDLDLSAVLVAEVPSERIRSKVDELLEPLAAKPRMLEALRAYFEHDLDVMKTAEALDLHPNSARYRLSRVEGLVNRRLRDPAAIADLHTALLAREYVRDAEREVGMASTAFD